MKGVVQKMDNALHLISVVSLVYFVKTYPCFSNKYSSGGEHYPFFDQLDPGSRSKFGKVKYRGTVLRLNECILVFPLQWTWTALISLQATLAVSLPHWCSGKMQGLLLEDRFHKQVIVSCHN